ncbi:CP2U1-like protein [Mya arenaria]|uniref:unspecific monooxygenase n=1 Tax=Mya arenaria TaxID=6604 RepID=A0ABY7G2N2_MYAAR|nr:CP2U1-like protein [Mya arenaria]
MSELPLTEATILETMRHSCIFPFALPHSTTSDTEIGGHFVKNKTLVVVIFWSVSHDPEYLTEPDVFNPKRILNDTCTKAELFLPFGVGMGRCPGEILAKIAFLDFSSVDGETPIVDSKYGLTLKPMNFNVLVSKRQ